MSQVIDTPLPTLFPDELDQRIGAPGRREYDSLCVSTNPKDALGNLKMPLHLWPAEATAVGCLGMLEGAEKYGRNNFIAGDGIVATVYIAAAMRHLQDWLEGEAVTRDTGNPHLGNALATIAIVVKAEAHGKLIDDRNYSPAPGAYQRLVERLTPQVKRLKEMFKERKPKHWTIADQGAEE